MSGHYQVERWSGRRNNTTNIIFSGSRDKAIKVYEETKANMRQGTVRLINQTGEIVSASNAPNLRTRW